MLIQLDRLVQRFQQPFAHLQLGVLVRQHVQLLQLSRRRQCRFLQLLGRHYLVEEACVHRALRVKHLGIDHRAVEGRAAQAVAGQFYTGMVHGHADLHFVQAHLVRPFDANAIVARQQQEGTLGHGIARAGDYHRERVRKQAAGEGGAGGDQADCFLGAAGHHFEVVAARQDAGLPGDDHHRAFFSGAV